LKGVHTLANHKSALKRAKQNELRRLRNKTIKTRTRSVTKSIQLAISGDAQDVPAASLNEAKSVIQKAAKKGVLHKNTAARKISRLSKRVNSKAS
jgi:small subunit ribosomal protein S20